MAPFLAEWTKANQSVAAAAADARIKVFSVQYALYTDDTEPPSPAALALSTPELLLTPPTIAARLGPTTFALWSDAAAALASVDRAIDRAPGRRRDLAGAIPRIAPARGGGYAELGVGPWSVRDAPGSASLKAAVAALECLPGLQIERHSGHDV